ncbi:hypothetical protein OKW43_006738 [Paraburkholderia sp. WC7.3g]
MQLAFEKRPLRTASTALVQYGRVLGSTQMRGSPWPFKTCFHKGNRFCAGMSLWSTTKLAGSRCNPRPKPRRKVSSTKGNGFCAKSNGLKHPAHRSTGPSRNIAQKPLPADPSHVNTLRAEPESRANVPRVAKRAPSTHQNRHPLSWTLRYLHKKRYLRPRTKPSGQLTWCTVDVTAWSHQNHGRNARRTKTSNPARPARGGFSTKTVTLIG